MTAAATAAAMRAAADLIEISGIASVLVICDENEVTMQVAQRAGDAAGRAALVARLAGLLGAAVVRHQAPDRPLAWVQARSTAGPLPVRVHTHIDVLRDGSRTPLARTPRGEITGWDHTIRIPPGWQWVTELDDPGGAALQEAL